VSAFTKITKGVVVSLVVAVAVSCVFARRVVGTDMAWTLQPGDLVWVFPSTIQRGDLVQLADPFDPTRQVLRRAIAGEGQMILMDNDGVRVDRKRLRQMEMGRTETHRVLKEVQWSKPPARANRWFVRRLLEPVRWEMDHKIEVPEGHWYLLADDRDGALDSRWWGPVPASDITGVARLRVSIADFWRAPTVGEGASDWREPVELLVIEE